MEKMTTDEAVEIIKAELGKKADDKRTKVHKAFKKVEKKVNIDEERLLEFVERFLEEYEAENRSTD